MGKKSQKEREQEIWDRVARFIGWEVWARNGSKRCHPNHPDPRFQRDGGHIDCRVKLWARLSDMTENSPDDRDGYAPATGEEPWQDVNAGNAGYHPGFFTSSLADFNSKVMPEIERQGLASQWAIALKKAVGGNLVKAVSANAYYRCKALVAVLDSVPAPTERAEKQ
jgi:hypothetical protein